MIKKLAKHGNSYSIVIDKPILELLKITPDTPLEIITDGNDIIIHPIRNIATEEEFKRSAEKILKKYRNVFRRLAE